MTGSLDVRVYPAVTRVVDLEILMGRSATILPAL